MCRPQHEMALRVDELCFGPRVGAPQHEDEMLALSGQQADGSVCEHFPSLALVRGGLTLANGQRGVQQEHALLGV